MCTPLPLALLIQHASPCPERRAVEPLYTASRATRRQEGEGGFLTLTPSYTAALDGSESITETMRVVGTKSAEACKVDTAAAISAALSGVSGWCLPPAPLAVAACAVATACGRALSSPSAFCLIPGARP